MRKLLWVPYFAYLAFAQPAMAQDEDRGKSAVKVDFIALETPYEVRSDAAEKDQFDESALPFLTLQQRFWKAKSWEEMAALYTGQSVDYLEQAGEKEFYEKAIRDGWFKGSLTVTGYAWIRSGDAELMIAQALPTEFKDQPTDLFMTIVVRNVDGTWKFDSLAELSPIAGIVSTVPVAQWRRNLMIRAE